MTTIISAAAIVVQSGRSCVHPWIGAKIVVPVTDLQADFIRRQFIAYPGRLLGGLPISKGIALPFNDFVLD